MSSIEKPDSPFYDTHILPPEKFFDREELSDEIMQQCILPTVQHKRSSQLWIRGERGIGKSSLGHFLMDESQKKNIFTLHLDLSQIHDLSSFVNQLTRKINDNSRAETPIGKKIKRFIESLDFELSTPFFSIKKSSNENEGYEELIGIENILKKFALSLRESIDDKEPVYKGFLLFLDEINGISKDPKFANFLKGYTDTIGSHSSIILMVCGTEEKRQEIIRNHESVNRIFRLYEVNPIPTTKMKDFYQSRFESVGMHFANQEDLERLAYHSQGQPKFAQIFGQKLYESIPAGVSEISSKAVEESLMKALEEIGRLFYEPLYQKLTRNPKYKKILLQIADLVPDQSLTFRRQDILKLLSEEEQKVFDNFLNDSKKLHVFKKNTASGNYEFTDFRTKVFLNIYVSIPNLSKETKK